MFNFKKLVFIILSLLFFWHGILYYFFPQYHYTEASGGGWISYIKYLCLIGVIPFLVHYRFDKTTGAWLYTGLMLLVSTLFASAFWVNEFNFLLIQYQIPIATYFFAGFILKYFTDEALLKNLALLFIGAITSALVFEFLFGGIIGDYSRGGIRGVGPFVNPNNTGIVTALIAAIFHYYENRVLRNLYVALVVLFIILLTGSKTALLLYFICLIFLRSNYWRYLLLASVGVIVLINLDQLVLYWEVLELREFSVESGSIRIDDASVAFVEIFSGSFLNIIFGSNVVSVVDNAYLDILVFGGLSILLPFLLTQFLSVYLSIKNGYNLILLLHLMIFMSMLTTNIPRLWPVAYIYWAIVGISFLKSMRSIRNRSCTDGNNSRKAY